jgi:hypothetical protein
MELRHGQADDREAGDCCIQKPGQKKKKNRQLPAPSRAGWELKAEQVESVEKLWFHHVNGIGPENGEASLWPRLGNAPGAARLFPRPAGGGRRSALFLFIPTDWLPRHRRSLWRENTVLERERGMSKLEPVSDPGPQHSQNPGTRNKLRPARRRLNCCSTPNPSHLCYKTYVYVIIWKKALGIAAPANAGTAGQARHPVLNHCFQFCLTCIKLEEWMNKEIQVHDFFVSRFLFLTHYQYCSMNDWIKIDEERFGKMPGPTDLILAFLHAVAAPRHRCRGRRCGWRHCRPILAPAPQQPPPLAMPHHHVLERPSSPFTDRPTYWSMEPSDPDVSPWGRWGRPCAIHG